MPHDKLNQMIFTFNRKLSLEDLSNMITADTGLEKLIKKLKCMRGVDQDFVATFKFMQFRKSSIKDIVTKEEQIMLTFNDVSQKIFFDTSKAEGELLSLINSTISHEMRNPLNSIINQCKLLYSFLIQQYEVIGRNKQAIGAEAMVAIDDLHNEMMSSVKVMTSSSNMLLLNVEDILGYAQLKAGKFMKNIQRFNVKNTIDEIVSI